MFRRRKTVRGRQTTRNKKKRRTPHTNFTIFILGRYFVKNSSHFWIPNTMFTSLKKARQCYQERQQNHHISWKTITHSNPDCEAPRPESVSSYLQCAWWHYMSVPCSTGTMKTETLTCWRRDKLAFQLFFSRLSQGRLKERTHFSRDQYVGLHRLRYSSCFLCVAAAWSIFLE